MTRGRLRLAALPEPSSMLPNSFPHFVPGFSTGSLSFSWFLWAPATPTDEHGSRQLGWEEPRRFLQRFAEIWEAACSAGLCWDPALGMLLGAHGGDWGAAIDS